MLTNTGTGYTVRRRDTGAAVAFTGTGTAADPILFDGLSVVVGAGAATGDQFVIHPTRDAIQGFSVAITDPARVAAAAPIRAAAAAGNSRHGQDHAGRSAGFDRRGSCSPPSNIVFTSASHLLGQRRCRPVAYTAGGNIDVNGWRVQIGGAPATGDTFTVRNNAGAVGDNRNAFALADAMQRRRDRGRHRLGVRRRGAAHRQSRPADPRGADEPRRGEHRSTRATSRPRDAVSGVNLDEEAANMLRYQQAYQAAAQIISAANQMFDTLLNAVRR